MPDASEVLTAIGEIARRELDLPREVRAQDDLLHDLQLDSVQVLTLVVALEDRFRIALAEEDAARVRTAQDLAELVSSRVAAS